jgi:hypothetical protein
LSILTGRTEFLAEYGDLELIVRNFIWKDQNGEVHSIFRPVNGGLELSLGKFTLIMLPRGFAKTTIAGIAVPLYEILYRDHPFFLYVSEAALHSRMQLDNVKRELTSNALVLQVFGDLKPAYRDDERWAGDFFETRTGIAMAARGRGSQIRGLNHLGRRPSKIIVDDVEDKESVSTREQRDKTKAWAYGDLIPALPKLDPNATIVALGTLLHKEALLSTWAEDSRWTVVKMGALDVDENPLWAENMDEEDLVKEKRSFAAAGMLDVFYMEYFNIARAAETQLFKQEWLKWGEPRLDEEIHSAVYIDPAISEKRTADHAVITVASISSKGQIYVRDQWGKRGASVREQVDKFFEFHQRYNCSKAGVESNAFQAALIHVMREEMFRKQATSSTPGTFLSWKSSSLTLETPRPSSRTITPTLWLVRWLFSTPTPPRLQGTLT